MNGLCANVVPSWFGMNRRLTGSNLQLCRQSRLTGMLHKWMASCKPLIHQTP